jgi:hypothetical protein
MKTQLMRRNITLCLKYGLYGQALPLYPSKLYRTLTVIMLLFAGALQHVHAQVTCLPAETSVTLYRSYGISEANNGDVQNPEHALGYTNAAFAMLEPSFRSGQRGEITIEFTDVVPMNDTIWFRTGSDALLEASLYRVSSSFNGVLFDNVVDYVAPVPGEVLREDFYVVANPFGVKYIRFKCNDNKIGTWLESTYYKRRECYTYCGIDSLNYTSGTAVAFDSSSTAINSHLAVGVPDRQGVELRGDLDEFLVLDLGQTIPYGAYIQLYLARDTASVPLQVSGSLNGSTFNGAVTIDPQQSLNTYTSYFYQVNQPGGIRYLKFLVVLDFTVAYVDGVDFLFPKIFGRNVVSGYVYDDANSNGIRNVGETGVAGVKLDLYVDTDADNVLDAGDVFVQSTNTMAQGAYEFETYSLETNYLVVLDQTTLPDYSQLTVNNVQPLVFSQLNEGACLDFSYEDCTGGCPAEAYDDNASTLMNTAVNISVLDNDRGNLDTASLSVSGLLAPAYGSVTIGAGGVITYTPDPNFAGTDQFEYQVCSDFFPFSCATAMVYVTVDCAPIPGQNTIMGIIFEDLDEDGTFDSGETWTRPEIITVRLYDDANANGIADAGEALLATTTTDASGNYQFNLANAAADYVVDIDQATIPSGAAFTTPLSYAVAFTGGDETYCGSNIGFAFCAPNCPLIAVDDNVISEEGTAVYLDVLANDIDFDGDFDESSVAIISKPSNGNVVVGSDGQIIYIPNGTFVGTDAFNYMVCDESSPTPHCDTATVTVTVELSFVNPCAEAVREHTFFLPYPEQELRTALINSASLTCGGYIDDIARSVTTIKSPYPGIEITWDHWEDGYEADITTPVQSTTLVWGDGKLDNGIVPGYPDDIIPAGGNIVLDNNLAFNPRNPANIYFDGKDKLFTSGDIALSRIVGDRDQFAVQAAKTDVYDINRFGTSFTVPFGENLGNEFQYTSLFIRAGVNGATVSVDKNNDGIVDNESILGQGEVMFVDGGVLGGATISATDDVGVDVLFGGLDCYGTRQICILPAEFYSHTYYTPVPTTLGSAPAAVYFYNSLPTNMTIEWFSSFNTGSFNVSAKSTYKFVLNDDSGYKFHSISNKSYTAMEVVDSDGDGDAYDWSFNLISSARLTQFASIAWAPGTVDGRANYNPIWVTPTANTTIYIKYDGNLADEESLESPCGVPYDESIVLGELSYYKVFDDTDNDQSGVAVYTCDGTPIVAVYGEDPSAGSPTPTSNPALDVGTTIQPMCLQPLILATNDKAVCPPNDFVVIDVLSNDFGFLTTIDTGSVSTEGLMQPMNGTITINADGTITYTPDADFTGIDEFEYTVCSVEYPGLCDIALVTVTVSECVAEADENLVNGYVFLEMLPDDGIYYDEDRMPGFLVNLWGDTDCDGVIDGDERIIETTATNANGSYTFSTINGQFAKDDFDNSEPVNGGNDGSIVWDNNWQEITATNGFDSDPVYIDHDVADGDTALVINGASSGASRNVTFSSMQQVTLSFSYRRQSMENEGEALQVRVNGFTVYNIDDGDGIGSDAYYVPVSLTIPFSYINQGIPNTLEFVTNAATSSLDYFYIDDVKFVFITEDVCFITQIDVSDKNSAYLAASLDTDTARFSGLGSCSNDNYLGVLANIVANDDYGSGEIDNPLTINVLANDIGETDPLSVTTAGLQQPTYGTVSVNLDGSIVYTPDPGYEGADWFEYRVYSLEDPLVSDVARVDVKVSCLVVAGSNTIAGSVFFDYNENGIYDATEQLIPDATLYLFEDENSNGILDGTEGDTALDTILSPAGNFTFIIPTPEIQNSVSVSVVLSVDDAQENKKGNMNLNADDLTLYNDVPYAGMRFQNINIPQGAVILSSRIKFFAFSSRSSSVDLQFSAEDDDLPAAFSTDKRDIRRRWDNSNVVDWPNVEPWSAGNQYYSPDLTSLVQTLVNRTDWNQGDNMAILLKWVSGSERSIRSFDYDGVGEFAPVLEVTYGVNDYPITYIVQVDTTTLPTGGYLTTDNTELAPFTVPAESDCKNNFGIAINNTTAINDINATLENIPVGGNVITNDYDVQDDNILFGTFMAQDGSGSPIVSGAALSGIDLNGDPVVVAGTLSFDVKGVYTFTPQAGFTGEVIVPYAMCDDGRVPVCDTADLNISVVLFTNPNFNTSNSLVAEDDYAVSYGSLRVGDALANDSDPELNNFSMQSFTYDSDGDGDTDAAGTFGTSTFIGGVDQFGKPTNKAGSLTMYSDGYYLFTPEPGFVGVVIVEYTICDDFEAPYTACSSARLTIEVLGPKPGALNLPPFAGDDYASTPIDHPVVAKWIFNDNDEDSTLLTLYTLADTIDTDNLGTGNVLTTRVTREGGTLSFMDDGRFRYTPPLGYYGPDQLNYYICDVAPVAECDSATIYLNVTPIRFDYGDLGPLYDVAQHMIPLDVEADGIPDLPGSIWLGSIVDAEVSPKESEFADGDDLDNTNDEQGVIFPSEITPGQDAFFKVIVNGSDPGMTVHFGIWIDWDINGEFDDFYKGSGITRAEDQRNRDTVLVPITVPAVLPSTMVFFRARAFQAVPDILDYGVAMRSGEAEDYRWDITGLLPVEMVYFNAEAFRGDAYLSWHTASELNNDYFSVQRSRDALNWEEIGVVGGHGTTEYPHDYGYVDPGLSDGRYYYRLQQFDFDGTYDYSLIVSVLIEGSEIRAGNDIVIYPNPAKATGIIEIKGLEEGPAHVSIVSMEGGYMVNLPIEADQRSIDLDPYGLPTGMYIVTADQHGVIRQQKVLIMR